jgi:NADH:ubiquinone oxidoreductase subunit 5 (subunit L)/multisubunit Na+/H+ antiporter MnhA subunit
METSRLCLLLALALPLLGGPISAIAGRRFGSRIGWFALLVPVSVVAALLTLATAVDLPGQTIIEWSWVPSLGVDASFIVDGLSMFFGLVVSGMGCLIVFYAIHYLDVSVAHQGRFYCYLLLFMASMLGTVFANNLLLLFVFWELTGLASFLLIGFFHGDESSRVGARQAILVTGTTGLVFLAGLVLLHSVTGTYDFAALAEAGLPFAESSTQLTVAMSLILVGAFGKSAQFPFHFWLPNAMAAPTPVSAYLHSATMVKLGVFLCARIFPLFVENELWTPIVSLVSFSTMLLAAVLALLSHDLKAILAWSTVSQLGYLIGHYGLGRAEGVEHDYLHIGSHVLYKGCLFMVVGIVVHSVGIRDIRQLGGLFRRLPLLGVTALIATASMAGVIGTTGFLSKELMLAEVLEAARDRGAIGIYTAGCAILASIVKAAFALRIFAGLFLGRERENAHAEFHPPSIWIQAPPLVLAAGTVVFGILPGLLDAPFARLVVDGSNRATSLELWHGLTVELAASVVILILGFWLYRLGARDDWRSCRIPLALRFDRYFEAAIERSSEFTGALVRVLRFDRPNDFLPIIIGFVVALLGGSLSWHVLLQDMMHDATHDGMHDATWRLLADAPWTWVDITRSFIAGLIALSVLGVVVLKRWTTQLIALSVAGFLVCFYFVLYRAPDLALTQILIEVVTLFLVLILLGRFPRTANQGESARRSSSARKAVQAMIALCTGAMATMAVLSVNASPSDDRVGRFYLDTTVPLAEGRNAVNTILVDYRGFDTLGEITVLLVATLGGLGLLMRYKRTTEEYEEGPMGPPGFGTDEEPKR